MKFGVCTGNDNIALAAEYGFDYIEANFKNIAMCSDDEFSNFLSLLKKNNAFFFANVIFLETHNREDDC